MWLAYGVATAFASTWCSVAPMTGGLRADPPQPRGRREEQAGEVETSSHGKSGLWAFVFAFAALMAVQFATGLFYMLNGSR